MRFFGYTLVRTADVFATNVGVDSLRQECRALRMAVDMWKAKYFYAKARAIVAERFRNPTITVTPRMVHDFDTECIIKSVEVEVGIRPAGEPEA